MWADSARSCPGPNSRAASPARDADRKAAADQKQELLRKMRERAQPESASDDAAQPDAAGQDAPAQS